MFGILSYLFTSVINLIILGISITATFLVYLDCLKRTSSQGSSIAWALLCFFGFPPLGYIVYYLKMVKNQF